MTMSPSTPWAMFSSTAGAASSSDPPLGEVAHGEDDGASSQAGTDESTSRLRFVVLEYVTSMYEVVG
uniref:Uncharacterized protein n=1 Tax=Oryza sativa subsp. japonica TaxID=39947 RepID=Q6K8V7_ORYSJ|nr:hypothetical protein [Oryza sativa Japonica Group]